MSVSHRPPLTSYQKWLLVFLSVATFFEGYDFMALSQTLPNLRAELGISSALGIHMVAVVNAGALLAYVLVRSADRWGRRRVLNLTIAGYTLCTLLSALCSTAATFTFFQFWARFFLIGDWAISMVYAAEEFPADRRGLAIGLIQGMASLGAIVCSGVVPLMLKTSLGWRMVYLVGVVPLVLLSWGRSRLRETERFVKGEMSGSPETQSLWRILYSPYRRRMLQMAAIWFFTYLCTLNVIMFWKEFVVAEREFTDQQVGHSLTTAAILAIPAVFGIGKLLDIIGRRKGAVLIYTIGIISTLGAFTLHSQTALTIAVTGCVFCVSAVLSVLNTLTTERFPTNLRSDAFAWSNSLLGRLGGVFSPLLLGYLHGRLGWGPSLAASSLFLLVALVLILIFVPETAGKELEETAAIDP